MLVREFKDRVMAVESFKFPFELVDRQEVSLRDDMALPFDYSSAKAARKEWTWAKFVENRLQLPKGISARLGGKVIRGNTKLKNLRL